MVYPYIEIQKFWEWAGEWREKVPKGVECIEKESEELLSFYDFPKRYWSKIRRRNGIERAFREIRSISCFENKRSCERIIYALVIYNNKKMGG